MNTTTLLLLGAAVYLIMQSRPVGGITQPRPTSTAPTSTSTPGGFGLTIPGVVNYQNVYGVGTKVALNPDFFSSLFGSGPEVAAPQPAPSYEEQYAYDETYFG